MRSFSPAVHPLNTHAQASSTYMPVHHLTSAINHTPLQKGKIPGGSRKKKNYPRLEPSRTLGYVADAMRVVCSAEVQFVKRDKIVRRSVVADDIFINKMRCQCVLVLL